MSKFSYDDQIAFLKEHPEQILSHWNQAKGLFKFVGEETNSDGIGEKETRDGHGCLTMIKSGFHLAYINGEVHVELSKKIKEDNRVPLYSGKIRIKDLEVFKEYQELADSLTK